MPSFLLKKSLTLHQELRLLCVGGRSNLSLVRSIQHLEIHMTNEILTIRLAQAALAVAATIASGLVLQLALVMG